MAMSTTSPTGMRRGTAHQKDFGDIVVDQSLGSQFGAGWGIQTEKRRVDTCSKGMSLFPRKWMFEYIYIHIIFFVCICVCIYVHISIFPFQLVPFEDDVFLLPKAFWLFPKGPKNPRA